MAGGRKADQVKDTCHLQPHQPSHLTVTGKKTSGIPREGERDVPTSNTFKTITGLEVFDDLDKKRDRINQTIAIF